MIVYLDTSLLVAALTDESATERVQDWLAAQEAGTLAISAWVRTEFASALSVKLRMGQLGLADRDAAWAAFARMQADNLLMLPIRGPIFGVAAGFAAQHTLGLRAGDALHLAICADHGAALHTLDRRMAEAGPVVGVNAVLA